jgi:P27 family predicted phage terminase small subunit
MPQVEKLVSVCEADRSTFQHFCEATAAYNSAVDDVQKNGSVLRLQTGDGGETVRQNPSVRHILDFGRCLDGLRQQLGLSPVARARLKIQVESEDDQDDFDRL